MAEAKQAAKVRFEGFDVVPDRARIVAALKGEPTDRVPYFENYIGAELVEFILGYPAGNTAAAVGDPYRGDERAIVDGGRCIPMHPEDWIKICKVIGQDVIMMETAFAPYRVLDERGKPTIVNDGRIKCRRDWEEKVIRPSEADIEESMGYLTEYIRLARKNNIAVAFCTGNMFITHYVNLNGFDFFTLVYDDPELVEEMLTVTSDWYTRMIERAVEAGLDILFSGDDVAYKSGTYMEPALFKEIYSRHARKMYAPALRADVPIIFDCDGDPTEIMDMIIDLGCSAHFPVDAAGLDYREHMRRWGDWLSFVGVLDLDPLIRLNTDEVEAYVKTVMLDMKECGRYIAGTITAIDEIPVENYVTMVNTIHRYAAY
jgi:uroporphyrinogen-III decarboxylase